MTKKVDKNTIIEDILSDENINIDKEIVGQVIDSFFKHTKEHILNGDDILFWGFLSVSYVSINNKNVAVKPGKTNERMILDGIMKPHIKLSKSITKAWKEKKEN